MQRVLTTPSPFRYDRQGEFALFVYLFDASITPVSKMEDACVNQKDNEKSWQMAAMVGAVGMEVVLLIVGGAWLGHWIDSVWKTKPIFLAIGFLLGLTIGFVSAAYTYKTVMKE
jgi:ATP synthase protein I